MCWGSRCPPLPQHQVPLSPTCRQAAVHCSAAVVVKDGASACCALYRRGTVLGGREEGREVAHALLTRSAPQIRWQGQPLQIASHEPQTLCVHTPGRLYPRGENCQLAGVRGGGNLVCSLFSSGTACAFSYYIHVSVLFKKDTFSPCPVLRARWSALEAALLWEPHSCLGPIGLGMAIAGVLW